MKVLLLLVVAAAANDSDMTNDILDKFREFTAKYKKDYNGDTIEMLHRLKIFYANMGRLHKMQARDKSAKYSHMTPLMDMSEAEYKARNTFRPKKATEKVAIEVGSLPKSFDWREHGAVNPVKDQAQCGSCWAFGTVCNIEGVHVVQGGGKLISLSEQELVDCSLYNHGCGGGDEDLAKLEMIKFDWGLVLEKDYGYHASQGTCKKSSYTQQVFLDSYMDISSDEDQMAAALMKYGPLSIGINAEPMQMYDGGIADPEDCDPDNIDHAVNIVGFGEEDGTKYWVVRNSWGPSWGEDGYYRLIRGVGRCGVNLETNTAIIKKDIVV